MLVPCSSSIRAEHLVMTAADIGENWVYPPGSLRLDEAGSLRPVRVGKDINPLSEATVRGAGATQSTAARAFDGDLATSWSPLPGTAPEDWWLEIDLGQVFPVQQIRLRFADERAALALFLTSRSPRASALSTAPTSSSKAPYSTASVSASPSTRYTT